ncbi:MBOAT family O-acyltransferase [Verrucomicrobiota bacterium]
MLFNSLHFAIFLPVVAVLYFAVPHRFRWPLLLVASYYFYMCWNVRYAGLIFFTTAVSYVTALWMGRVGSRSARLLLLNLSLVANLAVLFLFKYFNFFSDATHVALGALGVDYDAPVFRALLPVGISFYTFQALSYSMDVYRGDRTPEKHFGVFALYVSFFPQLVAGPIERSVRLLPQFFERHDFDYDRVTSGIKLMAWGFFKKLVIADRLAVAVNRVYANPSECQGVVLTIATIFFAYEIYCDFSGYSDIAIGAARILGFKLMVNFRCPYYSQSIREFWNRWHISLSSWFRDYVYIPLGGNRVAKWRWCLNVAIVFVVCGLWHGANWTFLVWGALHAAYLLVGAAGMPLRARVARALHLERIPVIHGMFRAAVTFFLVCVGWVFFRAESLGDAWYILSHAGEGMWALARNITDVGYVRGVLGQLGMRRAELQIVILAIAALESVQLGLAYGSLAQRFGRLPVVARWGVYYTFAVVLLVFGSFNTAQDFIYFQF